MHPSANELRGFTSFEFVHDARRYDVYRAGTDPAVIAIHGVPGVIPEMVRFANWIVDAGFTVYVPSLFGVPGKPQSAAYAVLEFARVCISREFSLWSQDRSSRIVEWLRALARDAFVECGGNGVGAIGMCLTGNFALAMMVEPCMMAPVVAQPVLPLPIGARRRRSLGLCEAEIAAARKRIGEGARILGFRFHGDPASPPERFETLRETFGDAFEAHELPASAANPSGPKPAHSVLTANLIDESGSLTKAAAERCLEFFGEQLYSPRRHENVRRFGP